MFRFKQFSVDQTGCAMKINTDGVLLGALVNAKYPKNILDIGTGTGVIALMLVQRFASANIDAVEIDSLAAKTSRRNFVNSPFSDRLNIYPVSFEDFFTENPDKKYDLIISNPPFYINSLKSPKANKKLAKHTDAAFFERLVNCLPKHLANDGTCWLILPIETAELVKEIADKNDFFVKKTIDVYSYPDSLPHRKILTLSLANTEQDSEKFVIYDEPKVYSREYQAALKDFFTIF
jgi:tRNA1Val (adenine37-N6)-methyltransferase